MVFFRPGDIVQFKPIDRRAYDQQWRMWRKAASTCAFARWRFPDAFLADPVGYPKSLQEVLA
jgi:hypothetical protein